MPYDWDYVPSYRLTDWIIDEFLQEVFENYDFFIQVNLTYLKRLIHFHLIGLSFAQMTHSGFGFQGRWMK